MENEKLLDLAVRLQSQLYLFLTRYRHLTNAHTSDFIVKDYWSTLLPSKFQDELNQLSNDEVLDMLCLEEIPPANDISIDIDAIETFSDFKFACSVLKAKFLEVVNFSAEGLGKNYKKCSNQPHVKGYMGEKKSYEIHKMASLCSGMCAEHGLNTVVDVGSGRGYLGEHLSSLYGLDVLSVDSSSGNTTSAEKRATVYRKHFKSATTFETETKRKGKHLNITAFVNSDVTISRLVLEHLPLETVCDAVDQISLEQMEELNGAAAPRGAIGEKQNGGIMLTGLHCCGDLTPSLLRAFVQEEFVLEEFELPDIYVTTAPSSFPLSDSLSKMAAWLGRNARMLAAQAPERIYEKKQLPIEALLWRAMLQVLLQDVKGELRSDWSVGRLAARSQTFVHYVRNAFRKLGFELTLSETAIDQYRTKYEADMRRKMACFFQLRAMLAPLVEALIVIDRLVFLLEQPEISSASILQLFDPVKSPRCFCLLALKKA